MPLRVRLDESQLREECRRRGWGHAWKWLRREKQDAHEHRHRVHRDTLIGSVHDTERLTVHDIQRIYTWYEGETC